jgi:transcriptional regulator with XRE-family HTH domain
MDSKDPFAARVAAGLRGRGLTLRGLCREAGLDPSFFSKVLAGKRSPPSDEAMLRRIAEVLGLDPVGLIVAAGRIPAEWRAFREDPELLQDVHDLATARGDAGRGLEPGTSPRSCCEPWSHRGPDGLAAAQRRWLDGAGPPARLGRPPWA